jgi:hypothetical protein
LAEISGAKESVVNLVRHAKKNHNKKINSLLSNPSTSAKQWWNIIKSYYGIKAGISVSPLQEGDSYIFDPKGKLMFLMTIL